MGKATDLAACERASLDVVPRRRPTTSRKALPCRKVDAALALYDVEPSEQTIGTSAMSW
jgi:hypothetical protein